MIVGKLITGDDGLLAGEVGAWAKRKHSDLCRYVDISRAVRKGFVAPGHAGASFIDLFCGPGRCRLEKTGEWIDGGVVAAWKKSQERGAPFTRVFIADIDPRRRQAAANRLRKLEAPVTEVDGAAVEAVHGVVRQLDPNGLHLAFLDPYNLKALNFDIIVALSRLKRIDMLVHISKMDLQRNAVSHALADDSSFDSFAPGWRAKMPVDQVQQELRRQVFLYWREKVAALGVWPSTRMDLLTGEKNQPLYYLLLAAKHELAQKFREKASNVERQGRLDV